MKIIILAAGKGERLMPLTRNTPKPLIELNDGMTLLETQLESIKKSGVIEEIILVVGYLAEQIEAKIKYYQNKGYKIRTVLNPFYGITNNLVSVWLAKHEMNDDDFLITNGDNVFSPKVFTDLVNNTSEGIFLTIIKNKKIYHEDDMKVKLTNKNKIAEVSKLIKNEEANAESPGLVKVSGRRYTELFKSILDKCVRNSDNHNKFWLETFNVLFKNGYDVDPFEIIGEDQWKEIDYHPDLSTLRKLLSTK